MNDKYSPEEQELIESLRENKFESGDLERAAELLATKIGDMSVSYTHLTLPTKRIV